MTRNLRKHKILNHPILGLFLLAVYAFAFVQIQQAIVFFVYKLLLFNSSTTMDNVIQAISAVLYAFICLWVHKLWFQKQYDGCLHIKNSMKASLYLLVPAILYCGENLMGLEHIGNPILAFVYALAPGVSEEVIFRCLPLSNAMRNVKKDYMMIVYVVISGIIFGCIHFINLFAGAGVSATLSQVVYATGLGILLGAVFIRTGTIVPCMILHVLIDFTSMLHEDVLTSVGVLEEVSFNVELVIMTALLFIIPTVLGIVVLRPSKWNEIRLLWQKKWSQN